MRARDRARVERKARELCAWEAPIVAERMVVLWAREIPDAYGVAFTWVPWVFLCETKWLTSDPTERADTIAHEIAHLIVWTRNADARTHGHEWSRCFRRLREHALEMEW
jgi:hypothetical protein